MRGLMLLTLVTALVGLSGCKTRQSYCRGPLPPGTIMAQRPICGPTAGPVPACAAWGPVGHPPSMFTPAPGSPLPVGPQQPAPFQPPPSGFSDPYGRMPATLPQFPQEPSQPGFTPQPTQPGFAPILPPSPPTDLGPQPSVRLDPWRPAPETREPAPVAPILPPGTVPGPTQDAWSPPRVEFGTPFPTLPETGIPSPPREPTPPPPQAPLLPPDAGPLQPAPVNPNPTPLLPPSESAFQPAPGTAPPPVAPPPTNPTPLLPPEEPTGPPAPEPPLNIPEQKEPSRRRMHAPPSPVDIPGFAEAATDVAVGLQPFPDGINWLAKQGYRTVVHLHAPGTDDQAARRQFEAKGLRFVSIEVTSQTVSRETVAQLQKLLDEAGNRPIFLYDRDGYLVGGLWYLKLRLHDRVDVTRAREEARRLGLNPDQDAYHRAMWNAVRLLAE